MKTFLALSCCLLWTAPTLTQPAPPRPLVLTHVVVIDGTDAPPQTDQTVIIQGGRIAALGRTGQIKQPSGTQVEAAARKQPSGEPKTQ